MKLPKSVAQLVAANPDKIDEAFTERDYGGERDDGWSIWLYLKRGWINRATETHSIHEDTAREVVHLFKNEVVKCECEDCRSGWIAA